MQVTLSPDLEDLIAGRMSTGNYASVSEVISDALRLLVERERTRAARQEELRHEIARGLEQLEAGLGAPLDMEAIKHKARQLHAATGWHPTSD